MGSRPEESNLTAPFPGLLCQKKYPLPFTTDRTISRPNCARGTANAPAPTWNCC